MGLFDFRDINKRNKRKETVLIACTSKEIRINNTALSFPTTYTCLKDILGEASRIEPTKNTKNMVYLWDDLGIYCSASDPGNMLMLLLVKDNRYGLGHQPKTNFTGMVSLDGAPLNDMIQEIPQYRPYILRNIIKENRPVAIALGWNPGI